ncbi:MAG: ABC transporter ATP-binding protein [Alphaproteobacteria bacterium]|nr:ABC transporter ATP-binding protein [Alphaproteobacteria bacterium]
MSFLSIRGLSKSYGPATRVLAGVDLEIGPGEFFTLLGPSGCGKTTLLRCIAGFIRQDEGTIHVGGERLDDKPAYRRDIGMVFQDYAVFPHLSVADNIAFGLKARKLPAAEMATRIAEALHTVHLEGYEKRLPAELSGGQQQRVGLARAMAIRPKLLLMDEPLSNLDAKLRVELREDIRDIQRRLGITTIYVTHDQEEALAVSDRICVMSAGNIEQVGAPHDIYRAPSTRFAAGFVGTMNFLQAEVAPGGRITIAGAAARLAGDASPGPVTLAIRPEHVGVERGDAPAGRAGFELPGKVLKTTFLGREAHLTIDTPAGPLAAEVLDPELTDLAMTGSTITVRLPFARLRGFGAAGTAVPLAFAP